MEHESPEPHPQQLNTDPDSDDTTLPACRRDGWTPFARRLFLEVLAETGRVNRACDYAGLSVTSAYALRHRDAAFAAGWDAACELARTALADALYERALDGTTETLTRNGEVIAERHRHDSRLSIAVLNRLDRRCDRAHALGARHIVLVDHWDEWLSLVGKGADDDARTLLESARSGSSSELQLPQLPLGRNPTGEGEGDDDTIDLSERCWWDEGEGVWMTDFPPPAGFEGYEDGDYGALDYQRACTAEEVAILAADRDADAAAGRAEDETLRDEWFKLLKSELAGSEDSERPQDEQQQESSPDADVHAPSSCSGE